MKAEQTMIFQDRINQHQRWLNIQLNVGKGSVKGKENDVISLYK